MHADKAGNSTAFILFMLRLIKEVLDDNVGINVGIKVLVLEYLRENPSASAKAVSLKIGYSQRQVERAIAALKEDGRLVREGSNKTGLWVIRD
ncbi:MAG: winged helix-turn-helix transcriptional regulator [Spirochaetales bacterium]|nr:winged helix-turn-helix transcriptional regulator [Spirochaetales bacterium]